MNTKVLAILGVIVIVIAVSFIVFLNPQLSGEQVSTSPTNTSSPTNTTSQPLPLPTMSTSMPIPEGLDSCASPSIIYAYVSKEQRDVAEKFLQVFFNEAERQGISLEGVSKCMVNASKEGLNLRIYPSLLVKGSVSSLQKHVKDNVSGLGVIDYSISEAISRYLKVNVTFTYHAKAFLVDGTSKWTKTNISISDGLVNTLQSIALARIDSVEKITGELPIKIEYRPTIIFYSEQDLTKGITYLVKLEDNYYTIRKQYMLAVAGFFSTRYVEVYFKPNITGENIPAIGSKDALIDLYVFEDYWCPYCAKFYEANHDLLLELLRNGTLSLSPLDFIVHRDIAKLHAFTRCLYNYTGDGWLYLNLTLTLYYKYIGGNEKPSIDLAIEILGNRVDKIIIDKALTCANETWERVLNETRYYNAEYSVRATPTFLFWSNESGRGILVEGYIDQKDFKEIIKWLQGKS